MSMRAELRGAIVPDCVARAVNFGSSIRLRI